LIDGPKKKNEIVQNEAKTFIDDRNFVFFFLIFRSFCRFCFQDAFIYSTQILALHCLNTLPKVSDPQDLKREK